MYLIPSFRTIPTDDISKHVFQVNQSSQLENDPEISSMTLGFGLLEMVNNAQKASRLFPSLIWRLCRKSVDGVEISIKYESKGIIIRLY